MKKVAIIGAGISGLFIANLFKEVQIIKLQSLKKIIKLIQKKVTEFNYQLIA